MSPSRNSLRPVARVRFPPPLSPATMMRDASRPISAALAGDPLQARDAVVETGGERLDLGHRGRRQRVAEVHHCDRHAAGGDDLAPGAVVALQKGSRLHPAAVDVIHARHRLGAGGPDEPDVDHVAVRLRGQLPSGDGQPRRGRDFLRVVPLQEGIPPPTHRGGFLGARFLDKLLPARRIARIHRRGKGAEDFPDARVDSRVVSDRGHCRAPC